MWCLYIYIYFKNVRTLSIRIPKLTFVNFGIFLFFLSFFLREGPSPHVGSAVLVKFFLEERLELFKEPYEMDKS